MAELDSFDKDDDDLEENTEVNKKKILLFILPALIAIGIAVGLYHTFGSSFKEVEGLPYKMLTQEAEKGKQTTIFYDLPEIITPLKNSATEIASFKISIELSNPEDIQKIEILLPRFYDIILAHTRELRTEEVEGAEGLYWLKEELLYRLKLAAAPIKIENINFKSFNIEKK